MFHVLKFTLFKVGFQSICISRVVCSCLRSLWQKHWLSVKLELKVEKLQNWKLIFQSQPLFKVGWELHHRPLSYFLLTSPPNQLTSSIFYKFPHSSWLFPLFTWTDFFTTPTSAGTMACYFIIFSFLLKWPPSLFSALPFPTHTTQKCLLNFLRCLRPIGQVHFANIMLVHIISGSNYWCKRNGKSDSAVRKWTMSANSFAPQ